MSLTKEQIIALRDAVTISQPAWDIVTALRGPDEKLRLSADGTLFPEDIKRATTCVIRHFLVWHKDLPAPKQPDEYYFQTVYGSISNHDSLEHVETRKALAATLEQESTLVHFLCHAKLAFIALGLKWDELND